MPAARSSTARAGLLTSAEGVADRSAVHVAGEEPDGGRCVSAGHLVELLVHELLELVDAVRLLDAFPSEGQHDGARVLRVGTPIDEGALVRALKSGRLGAACLDVFRQEPLPADSPLRRAPNGLLLPHASAISPEYLDLFLDEYIPMFNARFPPDGLGMRASGV